jgi:hypothetical protein
MKQASLALALFSLATAAPLHAQAASPDFASTVASTTAEMDEVIVSGKLDSLSQLRKALDRAEDRIYQRYNEINQGTQYDIECFTEAPTGSRQKVKKCQPRYVSDAMHEDAFDFLFRNRNSAIRLRSVAALAGSSQSFLRQAMLEAAQKDSQMQRAMVEHFLLRERYEKVLKEKLGNRRAVWD